MVVSINLFLSIFVYVFMFVCFVSLTETCKISFLLTICLAVLTVRLFQLAISRNIFAIMQDCEFFFINSGVK